MALSSLLIARENSIALLTLSAHKMVKYTQKIRPLLPTDCLRVFDHYVALALKGLNGVTFRNNQ